MTVALAFFLGGGRKDLRGVEEFRTFPLELIVVYAGRLSGEKFASRKEETKGVIHIKWLLISKVERWRKER